MLTVAGNAQGLHRAAQAYTLLLHAASPDIALVITSGETLFDYRTRWQ